MAQRSAPVADREKQRAGNFNVQFGFRPVEGYHLLRNFEKANEFSLV